MRVRESAENYLKAILVLEHSRGEVHAVDIARHLGVSKPSVSKAVDNLEREGYVTVEGRSIRPTEKGRELASSVIEKYLFFCNLLTSAGVVPKTAASEACSMEHRLSDDSFRRVRLLMKSYGFDGRPMRPVAAPCVEEKDEPLATPEAATA